MKTGHELVDAITEMRFEGIKIDHRWLGHPLLCNTESKRVQEGKSTGFRYDAAYVLAEILYFYSAKIDRDPEGHVVSVRKRFDHEVLWMDYGVWSAKLGMSKRELQDIVAFLKKKGLILSWAEPVRMRNGALTNNMPHFAPVAALVRELTYGDWKASHNSPTPTDGGLPNIREAGHENEKQTAGSPEYSGDGSLLKETPLPDMGETSTVRTTYISTQYQQHQAGSRLNATPVTNVGDDDVENLSMKETALPSLPTANDSRLQRDNARAAKSKAQREVAAGQTGLPGTSAAPLADGATQVLAERLIGLGVLANKIKSRGENGETVWLDGAHALAAKKAATCEKWLEWFPYLRRDIESSGKPLPNPGALLAWCIRNDQPAPASWQAEKDNQSAEHDRAARVERAKEQAQQKQQAEAESRAQSEAQTARADAGLQSAPEALRAAIEAESRKRLQVLGRVAGNGALASMQRAIWGDWNEGRWQVPSEAASALQTQAAARSEDSDGDEALAQLSPEQQAILKRGRILGSADASESFFAELSEAQQQQVLARARELAASLDIQETAVAFKAMRLKALRDMIAAGDIEVLAEAA